MSEEIVITPRLRFPEFRDAEGWLVTTFQNLFKIGNGRDYKHLSAGDVPVYGSGGYMLSVDDFLYEGESVCIGRKGTINNPMFLTGKFWTVDTLFFTHSFQQCLPKFVFAIFQNIDWLKHNEAGGVPSLSKANIDKISTAIPRLPEQQKIADCLSSLDELIAAQGRKVEALKTYKRGLMQQLFPREGETLPRLRFPEFRDTPEWVTTELGPMTLKVGSGITPAGGEKNYRAGGRPFVRSQNVGWGDLRLTDVAYIDEATHQTFESTEIRENDVLLNITGASIGRSAVADSRVVGGNVNQHVCIIRTKVNELDPVLLNQFLLSEFGQKQIDSFQAGGNRQGLNFAQIRSFELPVPPTELEQKRIADCLCSFDVIIAAEFAKLDTVRSEKKGLMQRLFPSPEDVHA